MNSATFRCPTTGDYVQHRFEDDPSAGRSSFLVVQCPACGKYHFVNLTTSKLLGHESEL
ncbi:MAG: hypothetical protein HY852_19585 [Bradyrhizobium sp.]|uniref:hypothetical protein n=1 Tax=Bradyrhizobium sp. TaxID=376 RepID=UPI0025BCDD16|nr:hypothetical protein [Bradyrhizobium sp.]MBI5264011.1 hypothetical protein [Bradyrhizobium sp.]